MELGYLSVEQGGLNNMHVCHEVSLILKCLGEYLFRSGSSDC